MRYADAVIDATRNRLICVREDHTVAEREAVNTLVSIDLSGGENSGQILVSGNDFYSSPKISPDGIETGMAYLEPSKHALGRNRIVDRRSNAPMEV